MSAAVDQAAHNRLRCLRVPHARSMQQLRRVQPPTSLRLPHASSVPQLRRAQPSTCGPTSTPCKIDAAAAVQRGRGGRTSTTKTDTTENERIRASTLYQVLHSIPAPRACVSTKENRLDAAACLKQTSCQQIGTRCSYSSVARTPHGRSKGWLCLR